MKVRFDTLDVTDRDRRAWRFRYNQPGLATWEEIRDWAQLLISEEFERMLEHLGEWDGGADE